ncbi:MAG: hypothetical protein KDB94_08535 [Acidobacteria bacterium]|nr:hypothetical protein [Acidobacteriota bacterium]
MATFPGGSAYAMAKDIAEGFLLVTERTFARFAPPELVQLQFEMDRALRDIRGAQPPIDDLQAVQQRNRKIQRLNGALSMLRAYKQRRRIGTPPPGGGS